MVSIDQNLYFFSISLLIVSICYLISSFLPIPDEKLREDIPPEILKYWDAFARTAKTSETPDHSDFHPCYDCESKPDEL